MASRVLSIPMSEEAYFELLKKSVLKLEYWNGVAVAMAGAQPIHARIETNIVGELFQKLRGSPFRPVVSNQAVKLAGSQGCVFPDVTVVCGEGEFETKGGIGCLIDPSVVVEILSPSTAAMDETDKLLAYTAMRSVREYLMVLTERYTAKLFFRRSPHEIWSVKLHALLTDSVDFASCGCSLTLAEIYGGVDLAGSGYYSEVPA